MKEELRQFILRTKQLTAMAEHSGDTVEDMLVSTTEELGEVAACISAEKGRKKKELKEDSKTESIDLVICALSIYFAKGGDPEDIAKIGLDKLNKWQKNIEQRAND